MKYVLLIIFSLIAIFSILWVRSNVISIEYRLSSLEEKKREMLNQRRILLAEKASLTSLVRIYNSDENLLVFPDRKKIIYISGNPETLVKSVSFKKNN